MSKKKIAELMINRIFEEANGLFLLNVSPRSEIDIAAVYTGLVAFLIAGFRNDNDLCFELTPTFQRKIMNRVSKKEYELSTGVLGHSYEQFRNQGIGIQYTSPDWRYKLKEAYIGMMISWLSMPQNNYSTNYMNEAFDRLADVAINTGVNNYEKIKQVNIEKTVVNNHDRVMFGISEVLAGRTANLSDADIVSELINLDLLKSNYDAEVFKGIYNMYLAYMKRDGAVLYDFMVDFYVKVGNILCNFSEYTEDSRIITYPDGGLQLYLSGHLKSHREKLGKIYDVIDNFAVDVREIIKEDFAELQQLYNANVFSHCITWYSAAVVTAIIHNESHCTFRSLIDHYNKCIYDENEIAIWQAIRWYNQEQEAESASIIDNKIHKDMADAITKATMIYSQEIDSIMRSKLTVMQKCRELGKSLFLINGLNISAGSGFGDTMIDLLEYFLNSIWELKM